MYHGAQITGLAILCFLGIAGGEDVVNFTDEPFDCPSECICLSSKQVLCNTGGLQEIPRRLDNGIEDLSLSKNDFNIIESDAFVKLRSLRKLTLDGNNITSIKPFAFRGLSRLTDLSIQYTPLNCIGSYSFATLHNLSFILLGHNRIKYIDENSFVGTSNIKLILLTNNPIVKIHSHAFSGLSYVDKLLFPSGIRIIEPDSFNGLQFIGLMKLISLDLINLQGFTFRGLCHVQNFTIQESDLGTIKTNAFSDMCHIDNVTIMNNKIDAIEEFKLNNDSEISTLTFHGNHVLRSSKYRDMILQVQTVSAVDNYFPCDCQIHELFDSDFVNYSVNEFKKVNYCISPIEFNGTPMSSVDFDSIAKCHDKVMQDNLDSSAQGHSNFSVFLIFNFIIFVR